MIELSSLISTLQLIIYGFYTVTIIRSLSFPIILFVNLLNAQKTNLIELRYTFNYCCLGCCQVNCDFDLIVLRRSLLF